MPTPSRASKVPPGAPPGPCGVPPGTHRRFRGEHRRLGGQLDGEDRPPRHASTVTVPPCAVTIACTRARPRPVEPAWREREASPRAKRSKTEGRRAGGMPGPSSWISTRTSGPPAHTRAVTVVPGGGGVGPGVGEEVDDDLVEAGGVGADEDGSSGAGSSSRQTWSGPAARSSPAASTTSGARSPLRYDNGCSASSRASSSRSSTRPVIRSASNSIRPSACGVPGPVDSRPRRVSSAYPRIEASGVRSS